MTATPMNRADLKLAFQQATTKLNELLQIADDLLIPVDVITQKTDPKSNDEVPVTKHLRTIIYPSKV
jgi:hypothetical protein